MTQISNRIAYLFTLRREKINTVLEKYNLNEYEYYLLSELFIKKKLSFKEVEESQRINKNVTYDIIQSLHDKGYVNIEGDYFTVTDEYLKIDRYINNDLKKIDDHFSHSMKYREYSEYVRILDELIDYYED